MLAFVGMVTFLRLVQSSIEDLAYAHRIGLLRGYSLRVAPELEPHLVSVRGASSSTAVEGERLEPSTWQLMLTVAGMVAVVNSVVAAGLAGWRWTALGVHPIAIPIVVGALTGALALRIA